MLYLLALVALFFGANGDSRSFTPKEPEFLNYNDKRVWIWLKKECVQKEIDAFQFKDEMLNNYECLKFNHRKHPTFYSCDINQSSWSLWFELNDEFDDFSCLDKAMELSFKEECISAVYFEPMQEKTVVEMKGYIDLSKTDLLDRLHDSQTCACEREFGGFSASQMWSLDVMDGMEDGMYKYYSFTANENSAAASIILDEGVDFNHVEFVGVSTSTLCNFNLNDVDFFDHGTHVAGTVQGINVGGAKGQAMWNYPVCQSATGCYWTDIQAGYNCAVAQMQSDPSTRYVINYSVGGRKSPTTTPEYDSWGAAIENAGGMWVTSAGNSAADACQYSPAYSTYAVTVGAYNVNLSPSTWFTNYGACVDTWGPGENVLSAMPGDSYGYASGTSMSSPGIAGLVINILKENPTWSSTQVRNYLSSNTFGMNGVPGSWQGSNRASYLNTGCSC